MFKDYRRKGVAEMRPVTKEEMILGLDPSISISTTDINNGSPLYGDMIARNPFDHNDQWLVAKEYFEQNFEEIK